MAYTKNQLKSVLGCDLLYNNEQVLLLNLEESFVSFKKLSVDKKSLITLNITPEKFLNDCLIYATEDDYSLCNVKEYFTHHNIG